MMNFFSYIHFFLGMVYTYLAISIFQANPKARLNKVCSILFACFIPWSFSMVFVHSPDTSLKIARLSHNIGALGWASFIAVYLWFVMVLAEEDRIMATSWFYPVIFMPPLVFILLQWNIGLLTDYHRYFYGWGYSWDLSWPAYLFFAYMFIYMSAAEYFLFRLLKRAHDPIKKKQYKVLFTAVNCTLFLGVAIDVVLPQMGLISIPKIADMICLVWAIGIIYGMVKYRFLSITSIVTSENIIATISDCLVLLDYEGKITFANNALLDFLGYNPEELTGSNVTKLFASSEIKPDMFMKWRSYENAAHYDTIFKAKDGRLLPVNLSASILQDKVGALVGFIFIARDIGERKRFEEELQSAYNTTKNIVENAPFGIFILDEEGKVEYVNPAMLHISGDDYHRFKNMNALENPKYIDIGLADNIRAGLKGRYFRMDSVNYISYINQRETVRNFVGIPIEEGEKRKLLMIVEDITLKRKAQEELKKAYENLQKTQAQLIQSEKMAGIGQLSAGIAHEINNPVGFVISNMEVMKDYINSFLSAFTRIEELLDSGTDTAKVKEEFARLKKDLNIAYVSEDFLSLRKEVLDGALRIKDIVANLKSFSHPHEEKFEPTDINQEIEKALFLVSNELKYNCEVVRQFAQLPKVFVNRSQMIQVFVNLLINAAQAIKTKGVITVKTFLEGSSVCMEFSDTGTGVEDEIKNKIFEPFFTTKKVGEGTGLGLSIAFGIIKNHNGTISVESEYGKGATFIIKLPVDQKYNEDI